MSYSSDRLKTSFTHTYTISCDKKMIFVVEKQRFELAEHHYQRDFVVIKTNNMGKGCLESVCAANCERRRGKS